jgi:hypothetical protein
MCYYESRVNSSSEFFLQPITYNLGSKNPASPLPYIHRPLNIPEVRVPGYDLVAPCPGSGKDDRIGDSLNLPIFQGILPSWLLPRQSGQQYFVHGYHRRRGGL